MARTTDRDAFSQLYPLLLAKAAKKAAPSRIGPDHHLAHRILSSNIARLEQTTSIWGLFRTARHNHPEITSRSICWVPIEQNRIPDAGDPY
jgi:hypothetical protein